MHCYQHENQQARGICKSCNKALCKECAVEADMAITCKGECEEYNAMVYRLMYASENMQQRMAKPKYSASSQLLLWVGLFLAIMCGGAYFFLKDDILFLLIAVAGLVLATSGYIEVKRMKTLFDPVEGSDNEGKNL